MRQHPAVVVPGSERARLVAAAQEHCLSHPLAGDLLADLASQLGVPLPEVRQHFADAEALVQAVVDALVDQLHAELFRQKEASPTAVAELWALAGWAQQQASRAAFFEHLQATYPVVWWRWQEHLDFFLLLHLRNNLRWGIMQDLYHAALPEEPVARRWLHALLTAGAGPQDLLQRLVADVATPAGALAVQRLAPPPAPRK